MSVSSGSYNQNHLLPVRRPGQESDDDASTLPLPSFHRRCSPMACPPPIGPLPEPSYQTQLLLGEMFSQQAVMRNYCADSIQAFMMALEDQKLQQEERLYEEEASLALARRLQRQEDQYPHRLNPYQPQLSSSSLFEQTRSLPHHSSHGQQQQHHHHHHGQSFVSSDLSYDFESVQSVSEESSSLESREHPDNFLTREAKLSAKERRGFEEEIMPFPAFTHSGTIGSSSTTTKDEKKMAAAYCLVAGAGPADSEKKQAAQQQHPSSLLPDADVQVVGGRKKKRRDRQCLICHRSTADCRLRMRKLGCGHQFCRSCIDRWLDTKDSCPYCRQKVSEQTRAKIRRQNSVGGITA